MHYTKGFQMIRRNILIALVASSVLVGWANADIVVTSIDRGVRAGATGAALDFHSTSLPGFYIKDVSSFGSSLAGTISSFAHQSSTTPSFVGPSMGGVGSADAMALASGLTGFSNIAESFFDIGFDVTATGFYKLDATVDWTGDLPPPFVGFATVELHDVSSLLLIDSVASTPASPSMHELHSSYLLFAGTHYRLYAEVEIAGGSDVGGLYGTSGSWGVTFGVPEPGCLTVLLTVSALCICRKRWRSAPSEMRARSNDQG
jgi:hypothetical protein